MKIGVPKEIKNHEYRVGLTPESVVEILKNNHEVFIQKDAGLEIGFPNEAYESAGATIIDSAKELYELSELIVTVSRAIPVIPVDASSNPVLGSPAKCKYAKTV